MLSTAEKAAAMWTLTVLPPSVTRLHLTDFAQANKTAIQTEEQGRANLSKGSSRWGPLGGPLNFGATVDPTAWDEQGNVETCVHAVGQKAPGDFSVVFGAANLYSVHASEKILEFSRCLMQIAFDGYYLVD